MLDDLKAIAPPPADPPPEPGAAPRPLPPDYLELTRVYGPGCFGEFLWLLVPGAENPNLDLTAQTERQLSALRTLGEDAGDLLPWAITDNGDVAYWRTTGEPDAWTVAINEGRGPEWHAFDGTATAFLAAWLSGRERVSVFPDDANPPPDTSFTR